MNNCQRISAAGVVLALTMGLLCQVLPSREPNCGDASTHTAAIKTRKCIDLATDLEATRKKVTD